MKNRVHRIALTGAPCGGKTSCKEAIKKHFAQQDVAVYHVPEAATIFIEGGLSPVNMKGRSQRIAFNENLLKTQLSLEDSFFDSFKEWDKERPVILLSDRGALDNKGFLSQDEWQSLLIRNNWNDIHLGSRYDAVIHLATAADGAEEHYTLENNQARSETPKQAREIDAKLKHAWMGHESYKFVDNSTDFDGKIQRVVSAIANVVGLPESYEHERKFLVPNDFELPEGTFVSVTIEQAYIDHDREGENRVRKRGRNGNYVHYLTTKRPGNIEIEEQVSPDQYLNLYRNKKEETLTIWKTRRCFIYGGYRFELDNYQMPDLPYDVLEVELSHPNEEVEIPPFIRIIKEVTGDSRWSNASIARNGWPDKI